MPTMLLNRREWPIFFVNVGYLTVFSAIAATRSNTEFLLYAAIVLLAAGGILWRQRVLRIDASILWGLTVWGLLHMSGGLIRVGDGVLYEVVLLPLIRRGELVVLRFDQCVHAFGFGVATCLCHHVLSKSLRRDARLGAGFWVLIVLMGCGVGAVNEMVEFLAVLIMPETGVGGYENTMLDLVFNAIGAVMAVAWLTGRRRTG
jgi:putative membrane protein